MIKLLLLTMLLAVWAPAQGAPDEGHEHPWSQQFQLRQSLQRSTSFGIEVEDGWVKKEVDELTSFYHPNGDGVLKIQSYSAPGVVDKERLRNLTNLDWSTPLAWQDWGGFSGYQYDYSERGSFFRQWWLVNQLTIIFVVYESSVELQETDIDEIDRIVNSMTVNES
ncbi:MAG: hypothetical protein IID57_08375 [Proteobacteria bacterium]|nr:hypothetical protein [Pseudomonadota bacterium]